MNIRLFHLAAALFVSLLLAGSAFAETDPIEISGLKRYDLGIWTLIVFGVLVFVLGKFAWRPIMDGLDKREHNLVQLKADAEKARVDAEEVLAQIKKQFAEAGGKAREILDQARRDAEKFREEEKARTAVDLQNERDRAKREIDVARDQALQEIYNKAVQLATVMSTKAVSPNAHPRGPQPTHRGVPRRTPAQYRYGEELTTNKRIGDKTENQEFNHE